MLAEDTSAVSDPVPIPLPADIPVDWKQIVGPIEPFLGKVAERLLEQVHGFHPGIVPYAQHALANHGKQLRPALLALSASATGKLQENHVLVAVIIEMVHLATLVHDDVMDEADLRRGRPTMAATWGNEISVLLGDCLFAHALKLAASFPTPEICRAVAAATNTVCSGEILQTQSRRNLHFSRAEYFKTLEMKTGELFALSCELEAQLSGANPNQRTALRQFGAALGTAYQIYDDCLDLCGSEDRAGKSLGTDLAKGKVTLPLLVVLEKGDAQVRSKLQGLIEDWHPSFLPQVRALMKRHSVLTESRITIDEYLACGRKFLSALPDSPSLTSLQGLAEFLAQQAEALGNEG